MIKKIEEIQNVKIKSIFEFLCENVEEKLLTKTGKISKDMQGSEKIIRSIKLKESILENTSLFTIEKIKINGRQEISVNKIEIDKPIAEIILATYKKNFERTIIKNNYQIIDYNIEFELAKEHKIMLEAKDNVHKLNEIIGKINNFNDCSALIDFNKLSFFVIKIEYNGKEILFFEKFDKIMKLDKTRLMKFFSRRNEKKFNMVGGNFLYIKYDLPCFLFDNEMYIMRKHTFEAIFDYEEKYKETCCNRENLNFISDLDIFSDFDNFKTELDTNNMNVLRKFAGIIQEKNMVQSLFQDFNEIKKLIRDQKISNLIIIENDKINVEKSNLQSILKLLNRDHLKHPITKENFESNSKIKR